MVMYLSGQNRPLLIPEMPLFLTFNIALVRKGMDLSHMAEGLTHPENFDPKTGKWKLMAMDVEYVRVYQDDSQGETRGLNPPITYQTRRKLLANRVTCDYVPKLCSLNNAGNADGVYGLSNATLANMANQRLSLQYGICCVEEDKSALEGNLLAADKPVCRATPKTKLPKWLLDSEYFQDPKLMYAEEGFSGGLAGTNPAGWKTYGTNPA